MLRGLLSLQLQQFTALGAITFAPHLICCEGAGKLFPETWQEGKTIGLKVLLII